MFEIALPLILFLLPLAYSPGPGNLFFAAIGARSGFAASLPATSGYHVATWIVTFAIGLGFSNLVEQFPFAFTFIKYFGSAYMLWLAWTFYSAGTLQEDLMPHSTSFWGGAVLLLLNPKAYMIITLMFTQFLPPDSQNFLMLVLFITTVFTLNNLLAFFIWTVIGDAMTRLFRTDRHARTINNVFAMMLVIIAGWMALK